MQHCSYLGWPFDQTYWTRGCYQGWLVKIGTETLFCTVFDVKIKVDKIPNIFQFFVPSKKER